MSLETETEDEMNTYKRVTKNITNKAADISEVLINRGKVEAAFESDAIVFRALDEMLELKEAYENALFELQLKYQRELDDFFETKLHEK